VDSKYLLCEVFLSLFPLVKIRTILNVYIHTQNGLYFRFSMVTNISLPTHFTMTSPYSMSYSML